MDKRKPIPQTVCSECHLTTPAWRDRCIHCGKKIEKPRKVPASARRQDAA